MILAELSTDNYEKLTDQGSLISNVGFTLHDPLWSQLPTGSFRQPLRVSLSNLRLIRLLKAKLLTFVVAEAHEGLRFRLRNSQIIPGLPTVA